MEISSSMQRQRSYTEDTPRLSKRRRFLQCLRLTPWLAFLSAALFVAGLVVWAVCASKLKGYTTDFWALLGASGDATDWLGSLVLTIILAVGVSGVSIAALVTALSLARTAQRSMLWGGCCCDWGLPEPWVFKAYQVTNALLCCLTWLLLLCSVLLLMATLLWLGAASVIDTGIRTGVALGEQLLAGGSITLEAAQDAAAGFQATASALVAALPLPAALRPVLGAVSGPYETFCAPVCLNLGSFAPLLGLPSSCVCGSVVLDAMQATAAAAAHAAVGALAGAGGMYLASTWLLMVLTAHHVHASYDRASARTLKDQRRAEYEAGFAADPKDCQLMSGASSVTTLPAADGGGGGGSRRGGREPRGLQLGSAGSGAAPSRV